MEEMKDKICGYNKKTLVIALVLILIIGAFFIGTRYEINKLIKMEILEGEAGEGICKGRDLIAGEIIAKTNNNITIRTSDGNIQNASISVAMKIVKKNEDVLASLNIGQQVEIRGLKNIDGSFSVLSIKQVSSDNKK